MRGIQLLGLRVRLFRLGCVFKDMHINPGLAQRSEPHQVPFSPSLSMHLNHDRHYAGMHYLPPFPDWIKSAGRIISTELVLCACAAPASLS
jgi:hypothetical protein